VETTLSSAALARGAHPWDTDRAVQNANALRLLLVLSGCGPGAGRVGPTGPSSVISSAVGTASRDFRVGAYWNAAVSPDNVPFNQLDYVALNFINPVSDCGDFATLDLPNVRDSIVPLAHAAGTQVTFVIGGGGNRDVDLHLEALARNPACYDVFAANIASILIRNHLDGVELDWEVPPDDLLPGFTLMLQSIRKAIGSKSLSVAIDGITDGHSYLDNSALPLVDFLMLMAYYEPSDQALASWLSPPRNVPAEKLRLGVPFFGQTATAQAAYAALIDADPAATAPCGDQINGFQIEGMRPIQELTRFAFDQGMGGVTAWHLSQDATDNRSLLNAIHDTAARLTLFPEWQPGVAFARGDVVKYQGNLYFASSDGAVGPPPGAPGFGPYQVIATQDAAAYYCPGDEVWSQGNVLRLIASSWQVQQAAPDFDPTVNYLPGALVHFHDALFVAVQPEGGVTPSNDPGWQPWVEDPPFLSDHSYAAGDFVNYQAGRFECVQASQGSDPLLAKGAWEPAGQ
jgi:hypothetical protein